MTRTLFRAALAAACCLSLSPALAADALLAKMDLDGDGVTTVDEATLAQLSLFDGADVDGDGRLSPREHAALLHGISGRNAALGRGYAAAAPAPGRIDAFTFADSNADGTISRVEFHSISRRLAESLDRDRDGRLTEQDFPAMPGF